MSKFSDNFEETYGTTKRLRKRTLEFRKHNPKETASIDEMLNRFKKRRLK